MLPIVRFAGVPMAAVLAIAAAPSARAACGADVDTLCLAREVMEMTREIDHPMGRTMLDVQAAQYLPADEAAPLLARMRADAETIGQPGPRSLALTEIAVVMNVKGLAEGREMVRAQATHIFEDGPDDEMLIQTMGRDYAATEQIRRIARLQALFGDVEGAEVTIGYQANEADKVDTMFVVAEALAVGSGGPVGHLQREAGAPTVGDAGTAERILRQAMKRLGGIENPAPADQVKLTAVRVLARMGWTDEALALAETTAEINPRIEAIGIVVAVLAETGQVARAREQFARIAGLSANDNALWPLAMAVARSGSMEEARKMVNDMQYPIMREQAIGDLAAIQAGEGDLDGALDIIADLPKGFQRDRGLRLVLTALAESGRIEEAEDYAAGLADPGLRSTVIVPIAIARARAGRMDEAMATARAQPTPGARAQILLALAEALAKD